MKKEPEYDAYFFWFGISIIIFVLFYIILKKVFHIDLIDYAKPCMFHAITGFYCPGCGGTRAIFALVRGKFLTSLYYHPLVAYMVVLGIAFMFSQTLERITKRKFFFTIHFRMIYVWIALALIAIQFVWKNVSYLYTGIPPI